MCAQCAGYVAHVRRQLRCKARDVSGLNWFLHEHLGNLRTCHSVCQTDCVQLRSDEPLDYVGCDAPLDDESKLCPTLFSGCVPTHRPTGHHDGQLAARQIGSARSRLMPGWTARPTASVRLSRADSVGLSRADSVGLSRPDCVRCAVRLSRADSVGLSRSDCVRLSRPDCVRRSDRVGRAVDVPSEASGATPPCMISTAVQLRG